MQQMRIRPQQPHHRLTIVAVNRLLQRAGHPVRADPFLQLRPIGKPILPGDHQLRITQKKFRRRNCAVIRLVELRMPPPNSI